MYAFHRRLIPINDRVSCRLTDAAMRSRAPLRPVNLLCSSIQALSLPPALSCRPPPCTPAPPPSACGRCPTRSFLRLRQRWRSLAGCHWCTLPKGYRQTWRPRWACRPRQHLRRPSRKRLFLPGVPLMFSPDSISVWFLFFLVCCSFCSCSPFRWTVQAAMFPSRAFLAPRGRSLVLGIHRPPERG